MKKINMMKNILITMAATAILLTASCAKKTPADMSSNGADQSQTYGMNGSNGYGSDSEGFHVNALTAPSNQVYYFGFNESDVHQSDMKALLIQANYLANHTGSKVRLEGNTDNRGSREYNIGLGWRRDQAVARILEQQGVRPGQIQMISYGKEKPAAQGNNEHAWALNRRVVFVYTQK
ncbi:MAG: hypothetical protein A3F12_07490 [Gammaproteobacteria bacterium RIFCSPHIGHO2_12_FULL_38_14]|nr:MAG: hypothetical protein A3F12_07490 [Gammaproteobacteria bacterium RIFCSPHIGHO2_12_FULL_38_14]